MSSTFLLLLFFLFSFLTWAGSSCCNTWDDVLSRIEFSFLAFRFSSLDAMTGYENIIWGGVVAPTVSLRYLQVGGNFWVLLCGFLNLLERHTFSFVRLVLE
jgi:hypothetical protein